MKFRINDIEYCKNNNECVLTWSCSELCKERISSFKKKYSEIVDLTLPNKDLTKDDTIYYCDENYYYDNKLEINIMPLKRYLSYKDKFEKFTFLYLIRKYIKQTDIFENDVRDYIIKLLDEYNKTAEDYNEILYEEIIDIIMGFNDYRPSEILEDIILSAISEKFISTIQIKDTKLNIINENIIKNIIRRSIEFSENMSYGNFNLSADNWHPCSGCKYHKYSYGKNNCSLGNYCDDHDEENPCVDRH